MILIIGWKRGVLITDSKKIEVKEKGRFLVLVLWIFYKTCPVVALNAICCLSDSRAKNYYGGHRPAGCYRDMLLKET